MKIASYQRDKYFYRENVNSPNLSLNLLNLCIKGHLIPKMFQCSFLCLLRRRKKEGFQSVVLKFNVSEILYANLVILKTDKYSNKRCSRLLSHQRKKFK